MAKSEWAIYQTAVLTFLGPISPLTLFCFRISQQIAGNQRFPPFLNSSFDFFKHFSSSLSDPATLDMVASEIKELQANSERLTSISFDEIQLKDRGVLLLCQVLRKNTNLKSLSLNVGVRQIIFDFFRYFQLPSISFSLNSSFVLSPPILSFSFSQSF